MRVCLFIREFAANGTSYTFYLDGAIGVEVRASGYIQSAYFAANDEYGFQIHDFLSGSMHDHVLNFKADFDIAGEKNTIQLMSVVPVTTNYTWSGGKTRNTMKVERSFIESEDESRFNWAANGATQVLVVNQDSPNKYGELRGYRVAPAGGTVHLTVQNSSNLANAAQWAGYDVQVTKQHDHEQSVAHPYNSQDVYDPPINFDKYFNGESLNQTDLVVWLNLGMHHVPHTGDLPNTVFTTAHSSIMFSPVNYLLGNPAAQTVNMVRVDYDDGNTTHVEMFGQKTDTCELDFTPIEADLWGYTGDVVVRKFPFDPNNPFFETDDI